jgi:hypothetical protein
MRLLKLHPADDRNEGDPLPFPINAVRQLQSNRGRRVEQDPDMIDSIDHVEKAFARVDRAMRRVEKEVDDTFRPFLHNDDDGDRAA